jgi:hypothetical protein
MRSSDSQKNALGSNARACAAEDHLSNAQRPRNPAARDASPTKCFDKFPRWVAKDSDFPKLDELACKLLVYFAHVRGWTSDTTPWTTVEELAERVGANWRRTKRALLILGALGAIRTETKRREKRFKVIYLNPHDHSQEQATAGQTPLRSGKADSRITRTATATTTNVDVHLDASVEGRSPSGEYVESADNPDRFGTLNCRKRQASIEPAWPQTWDDIAAPKSSADASVYTAGEDRDSIAQGHPQ